MPRKFFPLLAAVMLVAGCAEQTYLSANQLGLGREPYRIGSLTVWIRPQPEVEFLCRLRSPGIPQNHRVNGCHLPNEQTIIAVEDPYVLLHELRHYFEGAWH